jgi:hypothetical protein
VVAAVRGSMVDICFEGNLPPNHALLYAQQGEIVIEVLARQLAGGFTSAVTGRVARQEPLRVKKGPP